jgi:hypothetical protein
MTQKWQPRCWDGSCRKAAVWFTSWRNGKEMVYPCYCEIHAQERNYRAFGYPMQCKNEVKDGKK